MRLHVQRLHLRTVQMGSRPDLHRDTTRFAALLQRVVYPQQTTRRRLELARVTRPVRFAVPRAFGAGLRECAPERFEEGLVREKVDVLDVVVGLVLALELLLRLARVHALEDAEPPAHDAWSV